MKAIGYRLKTLFLGFFYKKYCASTDEKQPIFFGSVLERKNIYRCDRIVQKEGSTCRSEK